MKRNILYIYIATALVLCIPVPGRFAYGIVLLLGYNFIMFTGTLFQRFIDKMQMGNLRSVILVVLLISESILMKQIVIIFSPIMALTLGFTFYLLACSSFFIGHFASECKMSLSDELNQNMKESLLFTGAGCLFFLMRDIFGYGTITLPNFEDIFQITLIEKPNFLVSTFFASIPGALVMIAIVIAVSLYIEKKMQILANTDISETEEENIYNE